MSVRQPWAHLIVTGRKSVEIRQWSDGYRGSLWIHASRTLDDAAMEYFRLPPLYTGGLIGQVDLVDILPLNPKRWEIWRDRHCVPGPMPFQAVAFMLEHPRQLADPIPMPGQLKFFKLPDSVLEVIPALSDRKLSP
nr:ASCH domain-containing protein [Mesorhizobium mediterraneum]